LIPDEVFRRLAKQAYTMAELSHDFRKDALINVFMSYLDIYVDQIHNIMSGYGGESEEEIIKSLSVNRVSC
jgi:hypothetical protein